MNIQDTAGELRNKAAAQKPHITCETNQIDPAAAQDLGDFRIVLRTVHTGRAEGCRRESELLCALDAWRARLVREHNCDVCVQLAQEDVIGDRFEVGSAAGKKNAQSRLRLAA